jgi:thymidylate kinase
MTMPDLGKLIVFEGADGVGKSTLVGRTEALLKASGVLFESYSFPGKAVGSLGWVVDQIQHDRHSFGLAGVTPLSVQALHIAAHLDHIESRILPKLSSGNWVILDRFWWSTWVYGTVDNVNSAVLETLISAEKEAWGSTVPSAVFLVSRTSSLRPEHSEEKHIRLSTLYHSIGDREEPNHPVYHISHDTIDESVEMIGKVFSNLGLPSA